MDFGNRHTRSGMTRSGINSRYESEAWQAGPPARLLADYAEMEAQHPCYATLQPHRERTAQS